MVNLIVKNLSINYGDNVVLDSINFEVMSGDFVAILGKSGVGKSTLLRCINKLSIANKGSIKINEEDIMLKKGKELENIRKNIAFIFQDYNVFDNLYTIDNVLLPFLSKKNLFFSLLGIYKKEEYDYALKYIKKVGLFNETYKKCKYLSGGQKQRVAIAKSICQNPKILLADEPISSLDKKNSEEIMKLFLKLNLKKKITILMNLHDVEIARKYSNRILGLKNGKILFYKETEKVTKNEIKELYI